MGAILCVVECLAEKTRNHKEESSDLLEVWRKKVRAFKLDMYKCNISSNNCRSLSSLCANYNREGLKGT